jgi:signal transduction histidine kinase
MSLSFIYIFHKFNRFLGTSAGELLKWGSELILLSFACYMVTSEWLRTKTKDLKYLLIGFGSLAIEKLFATFFLAHTVFAGISIRPYRDYIHVGENFLEITALILISSAFLYPIYKKHNISLRKKTSVELISAATIFLFSALVALNIFPFFPFGTRRRVILTSMALVQIAILWFPIIVFKMRNEFTAYNKAVAAAFVVYSITPVLNIINWIIYSGNNINLTVLAHPFPFIAIALFTRVLFLKLVDKATLKEELSVTQKKYVREKEVGKMKDEFVSTISHELRTPLTSIRLYLSLLLKGKFGKMNPQQHEKLKTVDKESARLTGLINDVLDLSRYEQKKESLKKKQTSIKRLVDSCLYPHLTAEKKIVVRNNIPSSIIANVDPDKFKQVIINLFTNAVKHTNEGSITFNATYENNALSLNITDTGRGIPADLLPYIFDRFYQAEGHMKRKTGGVGLGLAIVKNIIQLHNGKINVTSTINKGTSFTIDIPESEQK